MAKASTYPVYACRHCGRPVVFKNIYTYRPDPDGELLNIIFKGLSKVAVCPDCRRRLEYHQQTGNTDMRLPQTILIPKDADRVIDPRQRLEKAEIYLARADGKERGRISFPIKRSAPRS